MWAAGFKNAFDLAFVPGTNLAIAGESGPEAHDEINLVLPGHDYGYPGSTRGVTSAKGVTSPLFDYRSERTSPAGIVHYTGKPLPGPAGTIPDVREPRRGLIAFGSTVPTPRPPQLHPVAPQCTIDIAQTQDGRVVFSDGTAIYRLGQQ